MDEEIKQFTILDSLDINTVIYIINKNIINKIPKYTMERMKYEEEIKGQIREKTFFVDTPVTENKDLVIFSFGENKVIVNNGILEPDKVKISKKSRDMEYIPIYKEVEGQHEDVEYTSDLQRSLSILDPETGEEIKPEIYVEEKTGKIKGRYDLNPMKSYFAFEIPDNYKLVK